MADWLENFQEIARQLGMKTEDPKRKAAKGARGIPVPENFPVSPDIEFAPSYEPAPARTDEFAKLTKWPGNWKYVGPKNSEPVIQKRLNPDGSYSYRRSPPGGSNNPFMDWNDFDEMTNGGGGYYIDPTTGIPMPYLARHQGRRQD